MDSVFLVRIYKNKKNNNINLYILYLKWTVENDMERFRPKYDTYENFTTS